MIKRFCLFLVVLSVFVQWTNSASKGAHNFCDGINHGSYFEFTCCKGAMLDVGIEFISDWKKCATRSVEDDAKNVNDMMWKVFKCIVTSALKSDKVTLKKFATAMTKDYPSQIKTDIMSRIKTVELSEDDGSSSMESINAIRLTYHEIERAVCEDDSKMMPLKKLKQCNDGMDIFRENRHFRGDCCGGSQVPIRLNYLRHEASPEIQKCTLKMALTAGVVTPKAKPETDRLQQFQKKRFFNQSDVRQICLQTCTVEKDMEIPVDFISYLPFNYTEFAITATSFFPSELQNRILKYIDHDEIHNEVEDFISIHLHQFMASEFGPLANRTLLHRLFRTCEAHNTIVRRIEQGMLEACNSAPKESESNDQGPVFIENKTL